MAAPPVAPRTAPLVSVPLLAWFAVSFCALLSFYLPLSVVPSDLVARGAGPVAAGWVMAVLVLHAVAAELLAPRIVVHTGPTVLAVAGLVLMTLSGMGVATFSTVHVVLVLTAVRGIGFGLVVVVVAAQIARLLPAERRGEGLGWAGVVAGVPAVAGLPLGLWVADRHGATTASAAAALAAAVGVAAAPWARGVAPVGTGSDPVHLAGPRVLVAARRPQQRRPATVFVAVVASTGVLIAFLPSLALVTPRLTGVAILVHSLCATVTRLLAGIHGDRHGHRGWLWFGLLGSGAGFVALAFSPSPALLMVAMALSGAAFGAAQSASLTLMFEDAGPHDLPAVSALWNASYDLGLGLGPLLFGMVLVHTSSSAALMLVVCVLAACLLAARHRP
jgi:MFS family permease